MVVPFLISSNNNEFIATECLPWKEYVSAKSSKHYKPNQRLGSESRNFIIPLASTEMLPKSIRSLSLAFPTGNFKEGRKGVS